MATSQELNNRAVHTAQALATLGADPIWDAAVRKYLKREALDHAAYNFGPLSVAGEAHLRCVDNLTAQFGKAWKAKAGALKIYEPINAAFIKAETDYTKGYTEPFDDAALALARTPAPTLEAAIFKVSLISMHDIADIEVESMAIVTADMERVAA